MKHAMSAFLLGLLCIVATVSAGHAVQANDFLMGIELDINPTSDECSVFALFADKTTVEIAGNFTVTQASKEAGNLLFQCTGEQVSKPPTKAIKLNGNRSFNFSCFDGTDFQASENWTLLLTPSGIGHYTCHVNPSHTP